MLLFRAFTEENGTRNHMASQEKLENKIFRELKFLHKSMHCFFLPTFTLSPAGTSCPGKLCMPHIQKHLRSGLTGL